MYSPIQIKQRFKQDTTYSIPADRGINKRDLPQLLNPNFAIDIKNYLITTAGDLEKRKGIKELFDDGGTDGITMLELYDSDNLIYGYSNKVYVYNISGDTSTAIKTDFTTSDPFSGARYGDYFFVCNKGDKIGRITRTLDYDGQTGNFTAGLIVTGGTSGATGVVLEDNDTGTSGTLTLGEISGTFQNNEALTDSGSGAAVVDGTLDWTYTEISNAPKAAVLKVVETRLYAGNLSTDATAVQYSEVDDGSNPPFDAWSNSTTQTDGGLVRYRNAGPVRAIESLGPNIVVFSDDGKFAFVIDTLDSGGTISKYEQFTMYRQDFGGVRATVSTNDGIFYANESGLWQLTSIGQGDIPYSQQEFQTTKLLGIDYFDNIDLSNAAMAYDARNKHIFLSVRDDSDINNLIVAYNTEFGAISELIGWNVSRFLTIDGTSVIYGGQANSAKVWTCFDGNSDDGKDIWTELYQELQTGGLQTRDIIYGFYVQGEISPSTDIKVAFDIYDRSGVFVKDKQTWQWTGTVGSGTHDEFGSAIWGSSTWGGDVGAGGTYENFQGCRPMIRNFQRLRVRFTENSQSPHKINWFSIDTGVKAPIRERTLTETT